MGGITHCLWIGSLIDSSSPRLPDVGACLRRACDQAPMNQAIFHLETPCGTRFSVSQTPCLIGRSPACAVRLPSPEVSRRHAVILRDESGWWLVDAGSRGGTWLNDMRIAHASTLASGDMIGIGLTSLRFTPGEVVSGQCFNQNRLMETTRPGDAEWLVTGDTAVLWVGEDGKILGGSDDALIWMAAFFDGEKDRLPQCMEWWLAGDTAGRIPYERRVGDQRLRITACHKEEGRHLLVLRRLEPAFAAGSLTRLGLSRAEAELVPWLIRGKRNDEIATILGVVPKTVEKQVASILTKLGVETRTAAAWNIIERTGAHH